MLDATAIECYNHQARVQEKKEMADMGVRTKK